MSSPKKATRQELMLEALDHRPQDWRYRGDCEDLGSFGAGACACGHPIRYAFTIDDMRELRDPVVVGSTCISKIHGVGEELLKGTSADARRLAAETKERAAYEEALREHGRVGHDCREHYWAIKKDRLKAPAKLWRLVDGGQRRDFGSVPDNLRGLSVKGKTTWLQNEVVLMMQLLQLPGEPWDAPEGGEAQRRLADVPTGPQRRPDAPTGTARRVDAPGPQQRTLRRAQIPHPLPDGSVVSGVMRGRTRSVDGREREFKIDGVVVYHAVRNGHVVYTLDGGHRLLAGEVHEARMPEEPQQ